MMKWGCDSSVRKAKDKEFAERSASGRRGEKAKYKSVKVPKHCRRIEKLQGGSGIL